MAFRLLIRKPTNRIWEPKYNWADAVSKGIDKDVLNSLNSKELKEKKGGRPCETRRPPKGREWLKS